MPNLIVSHLTKWDHSVHGQSGRMIYLYSIFGGTPCKLTTGYTSWYFYVQIGLEKEYGKFVSKQRNDFSANIE
jgi:hypothetical protein